MIGSLAMALTMASLAHVPDKGEPPPTFVDDGRLRELTVTHNYMLGRPDHFRFTSDGKTLLFLRSSPDDARSNLWSKDVQSGEERRLLTPEDLIGSAKEELTAEQKALRERKRIKSGGFTSFTTSPDGAAVILEFSGEVFRFDLRTGQTARFALGAESVFDPRLSPDGRQLAFIRANNLHVFRLSETTEQKDGSVVGVIKGEVRALTVDGQPQRGHGVAEFIAAEEMDRYRGYWWSPDSRRIAFQTTDERHLESFTIADAARPQTPAQVFGYPRPGKENAKVSLHIIDVESRERVDIAWNARAYPYLARVIWPKPGRLSLLVQARDQRSQRFLHVNEATGLTVGLLDEADDAWLNLASSTPVWDDAGESFFWATEGRGAWALERHWLDASSDPLKVEREEVLVPPAAGFREIVAIDEDRGVIWFLGGPDPVEAHLFRAPLAGGAATRISPESGTHRAVFSDDGTTFVLTRATFEAPATSALFATPGLDAPVEAALVHRAPSAVRVVAKAARVPPRIERIAPEHAAGFHAVIVRPTAFESNRQYPVLLYVYGGPHHNTVTADTSRYHLHQWFADQGFVVVSLDGRGTMFRGRAFERALLGRFGDVPLEDQVKGLTALSKRYRELDLDRVGVYGWSFGGYLAALAALRRPDVFKVAVAGAPVVDWLYYDTHYTERYLGLPKEAPEAYSSSSVLTYADGLTRPLLLIHGIADDNVYFAHSLQLAEALFRAKKDFELLPLVGLTHQVADPEVREALYGKIARFLMKGLR